MLFYSYDQRYHGRFSWWWWYISVRSRGKGTEKQRNTRYQVTRNVEKLLWKPIPDWWVFRTTQTTAKNLSVFLFINLVYMCPFNGDSAVWGSQLTDYMFGDEQEHKTKTQRQTPSLLSWNRDTSPMFIIIRSRFSFVVYTNGGHSYTRLIVCYRTDFTIFIISLTLFIYHVKGKS